MAGAALHVRGVLLPDGEERDLYAVDGRLTYEPVPGAETVADRGWVLPGLVDCHCHVGLAPGGAVTDEETLLRQAAQDRDAGALLLRDAGVAGGQPGGAAPRRPAAAHPRRAARRPAEALPA